MMSKAQKIFFLLRHFRQCYPAISWATNELFFNRLAFLANYYGSDKGPGFHNYTRVYHAFMKKHACKSIHLLEIGLLKHSVQRCQNRASYDVAPSMSMWADYFPRGKIVGFDIAHFGKYSHERCSVIQGDQSKVEDLHRIVEHRKGAPFDFIIDDALHHTKHQQISLGFLFPHLKPGGLYFIEDLHYDPLRASHPDRVSMLNILAGLSNGTCTRIPYLDEYTSAYVCENIANIWYFDSGRRDITGKYAMAVIRKKD